MSACSAGKTTSSGATRVVPTAELVAARSSCELISIHLLTGPQTVIYLAARGTFASKGSHVGCQRAQQKKLRRMVQLRPQCVPSMSQNDVADADFGPGGWLRPGRSTRERPRAVGQAQETASDGIWMLGGGYPVISATIGCQIRLDRALSRRTPGTSAFS